MKKGAQKGRPRATKNHVYLHCSVARHTSLGMLLFTCEGPRSVDERDVIAVYRDAAMGSYCNATMILGGGEEISGRVLVAAIDRIEREIANEAA